MDQLLPFLIVCPLTAVAGFVDTVAGGGGLISLPAYLIAGVPVHMAIGTNKVNSVLSNIPAIGSFCKMGYIRLKLAILGIVCGLIGSAAGAQLTMLISEERFRIIMLILVPVTAVYILGGKVFREEEGAEVVRAVTPKALALCVLITLVIGIYDGFYGPGSGVFYLLLLVSVAGFSVREANGLCKVVMFCTNFAGTAVFLLHGQILWPLGLAAGVTQMLGSAVGARFFVKNGAHSTKPITLVVLAIFFIKMLLELR